MFMKRLTIHARRGFLPICTAISLLALTGLVCPTSGQIIPLVSGNSSALVDTGTQNGMFNWSVEGVNQLFQQWFWYRIGSGAGTFERSIDTISAPAIVTPAANQLTTTYANAGVGLSVRVDYVLSGGSIGSGTSTLLESLTINNISGTALDLHFFQYSDFDLGGNPGGDTVQLYKDITGKYNEADQTKGSTIFQETDVAPGADRGEADFFPATLNSLKDAGPTTLNNNASPVGPGDTTWAFEWDRLLNPGDSLIISKTKYIQVPEPGTLALTGLGLTVLLTLRRRKQG
jgi:hypothetical protein